MDNLVICGLMTATYVLVVSVCLKHLPWERWQIMASSPVQKLGAATWCGANLTYYGFFPATAVVAGSFLFMVLMNSLGIPPGRPFCSSSSCRVVLEGG